MAERTILTDDLDGSEAALHGEIPILGKVLVIDLSAEHATELDELLSRLGVFVAAGKLKRVRTAKPNA